ncbi:hypothetical protein [Dictyobacter kobayashii]|uniref:Uncharacterized protein n=1 Tax=Dictyobacter kobayashii TaxID=2014872 RepID=A0A402AVR6_9CHLR|nr:hypothetical protein [Dictyobacter kobayashii]GCE23187.1 hypothetical protein KDK_69870 [Dictyobacter kobayashii]
MKQSNTDFRNSVAIALDGISLVQDVGNMIADLIAKNFEDITGDILTLLVHGVQLWRDIALKNGATIPAGVLAAMAFIQTLSAMWDAGKTVVEAIGFFFGGGLSKAMADVAKEGIKDVTSMIKDQAGSIVTSSTGVLNTTIAWSQVNDAYIDSETPVQIAQWCQTSKASVCA